MQSEAPTQSPKSEATRTQKRELRAVHDRVLILPEDEPSGLIWMPSNPYKRTRIGRIVSMGMGMKVEGRGTVRFGQRIRPWKGAFDDLGYNRWPMPKVKVGDRVLYLVWSSNPVTINKVEHHIVRDNALELVFDEEPEKENAESHASPPP